MKEWNTHPIKEFKENQRVYWENYILCMSSSKFSVTNQTNVFPEALQTIAWDSTTTLELRRAKMIMMTVLFILRQTRKILR
jgi:hypothetical protein